MTMVTQKLKELQSELEVELKKETPDLKVIARLKSKIFTLGLQLTRNDMYLK
jgi:hypothetical protein